MSEQPDKKELICELGRLVGQKHAFSLVAGACMAADAEMPPPDSRREGITGH